MDTTGYRIQSLLTTDANPGRATTSNRDTPERTTVTAPVAVAGPSYGGPPDRRLNNTVDCRQIGGLPLHKLHDCSGVYSHSQNLTHGSASGYGSVSGYGNVSGYGSVSGYDSFRNANSDAWNWYTPGVGRDSSSLVLEQRSPSLYSGRTPARAMTQQFQNSNKEEEEEKEDENTQLRSTASRHSLHRTSATTTPSSMTANTKVRILG